MNKPISVRRNDFTAGFQRLVTETQLPPFVLRDALTIILHEVERAADAEYDRDLEQWQEANKDGVEELHENSLVD